MKRACLHQGLCLKDCSGIELKADFSALGLGFFLAYLLKRTLSKSVLVLLGLENMDNSTTKHHCVTHTLKKYTQVLLKGRTSSFQTPVLRLKEIFILCALEQSEGRRSRVPWMLKLLFFSPHISEKIELHGPLSFKRKNLEEQGRGFPQPFSHDTSEQEPEASVRIAH